MIIIDECLTGDTLVSTINGEVPISDVVAGSCVMTYNKGIVTESKVTSAWSSGEKEIIKIVTQSGAEIKCTKNHLIYTENGWIRASNITASSKVLLLAHVDAEQLCTKTNGGDNKFFQEDITTIKELWKNGVKNIKRSWILFRYVFAGAEKKQDSVTGLLWKRLLSQKGPRAFINTYMGMIKGQDNGQWNLPTVSAKPYLEPFLVMRAFYTQTKEALTQGYNLITATIRQHGLNIKKITSSALEVVYQGRLIEVTGNSLFLIPLNACRAWQISILYALMKVKKPSLLNGSIKLVRSALHGGFAMMDQVVAGLFYCIPKDILSKKTKLYAIGFQKIMGEQQSIEVQEGITGFICQQKPKEQLLIQSIPISLNSCNTRWHQVSCVQILQEKQKVYDITVEGTHCFFANMFLVHNCHHAAARQYKSLLSNYPDAYVLGLTATPERLDGKGMDDIFQDLLEVATVPQLIEQGFLVKPTCLSPSREMAEKIKESLSGLKIRGGDYDEGELGDAMDNKVLIGDIIEHWKEWAFGQKTIVFAASITHSQHIVEQFTNAGISAAHIDGKMGTKERERILSAWRTPELDVVS
ncbi:MAG: hypothetical protein H6688_02250, partial [Erysipelotrichaceae bacterium]|nr:hypothetical protein [Erysipelotrichaceae bacterium]